MKNKKLLFIILVIVCMFVITNTITNSMVDSKKDSPFRELEYKLPEGAKKEKSEKYYRLVNEINYNYGDSEKEYMKKCPFKISAYEKDTYGSIEEYLKKSLRSCKTYDYCTELEKVNVNGTKLFKYRKVDTYTAVDYYLVESDNYIYEVLFEDNFDSNETDKAHYEFCEKEKNDLINTIKIKK